MTFKKTKTDIKQLWTLLSIILLFGVVIVAASLAGSTVSVTLESKIRIANDPTSNSGVSVEGDTLVIGESNQERPGGQVSVYKKSGTVWIKDNTFAQPSGTFDWGAAVDVSGNSVMIGAPIGNYNKAWVYARTGSGWQQQIITANDSNRDPYNSDRFGRWVAIEGDTAVVGSPFDDDNGSQSGSVYIFTRSGSTWTQQAQLKGAQAGEAFGGSVAISGNTLVIGTSRETAYVFVRSGSSWTQQAKLTFDDQYGVFGAPVAIWGDTLFVSNIRANNQGGVHVYTRSGTTWSPQTLLMANDGVSGDLFGVSIGLYGDTAIIGAPGGTGSANRGAGYVFTRSGTTWAQKQKIVPSDAQDGDRYGGQASLDDNTLVLANTKYSRSNAYVYGYRIVTDNTPPSTPTGLTATLSGTSAQLSWNPSSDDTGIQEYQVFKNGNKISPPGLTATSFTDPGPLANCTAYTYFVRAVDFDGKISGDSNSASVGIDSQAPSQPKNLKATNGVDQGQSGKAQIVLNWDASTDNCPIAGYVIYRDNQEKARVSGISRTYFDRPLPDAVRYTYYVVAFDVKPNYSVPSSTVTITSLDVTPPNRPKNLSAPSSGVRDTSVSLNWTAPDATSDPGSAIRCYHIYRATGNSTSFTKIKSCHTGTSFTDTGLSRSTQYTYRVTALDTRDAANPSDLRNESLPPHPTVTVTTKILCVSKKPCV